MAPNRPMEQTETALQPLLVARDLRLFVRAPDRSVKIVDQVSFNIVQGEIFGLVGESGSGNTMIARAIMRLLPDWMLEVEGSLLFEDKEIATLSARQMRQLRGGRIAMIFQEPMTSLNPLM